MGNFASPRRAKPGRQRNKKQPPTLSRPPLLALPPYEKFAEPEDLGDPPSVEVECLFSFSTVPVSQDTRASATAIASFDGREHELELQARRAELQARQQQEEEQEEEEAQGWMCSCGFKNEHGVSKGQSGRHAVSSQTRAEAPLITNCLLPTMMTTMPQP